MREPGALVGESTPLFLLPRLPVPMADRETPSVCVCFIGGSGVEELGCQRCGGELPEGLKTYCSVKCQKPPLIKKPCAYCGKAWVPTQNKRKYHTRACWRKAKAAKTVEMFEKIKTLRDEGLVWPAVQKEMEKAGYTRTEANWRLIYYKHNK